MRNESMRLRQYKEKEEEPKHETQEEDITDLIDEFYSVENKKEW